MAKIVRSGIVSVRVTNRGRIERGLISTSILACLALATVACSQSGSSGTASEPLVTCILGHWDLDADATSVILPNPNAIYSMRIDEATITQSIFTPNAMESQSGAVTLTQTGTLSEVTTEYRLDGSALVIGTVISPYGVVDPSSTDPESVSEEVQLTGLTPGSRVNVDCEGYRLRLSSPDATSETVVFIGGNASLTGVSWGDH
ncbi:hypothetical protein U6G28_01100 [Actinomycetaceae bacterium MB13-C1-2]|nr:hypothetical protein U6G28_01100 [Actinomycetaceae bacterium MB13-C1-2]